MISAPQGRLSVVRPSAAAAGQPSSPRSWHEGTLASVLVTSASIVGIVVAVELVQPPALGVLIGIAIALPWIWRAPIRGLYLILGGAVVVEVFPLFFPDSLTDYLSLYLNLNDTLSWRGVSVTPIECLICAVAIIWIARNAESHTLKLPHGSLLTAYAVFAACVLMAEIHGLLSKGDFSLSLWELRPQAYGFAMFLLAGVLVTRVQNMERLALIVAVGITLKALIAVSRYFITMHSVLGVHDGALAHEDSYFLALFPAAALASLIWCPGRYTKLLVLTTPLTVVAVMVDQRRAGVAALVAAFAVVLAFGIRFRPDYRRWLVLLAVVLVIAGLAFVIAFWNHQTGALGQLVRPVRSLIDPNARDFSSDLYRQAENANLVVSFRSSPIIGMGFGIPYLTPYPMADISQIYSLWNVIPHNSLYWIGVRMGTIGYVAFWCLIGLAILNASRIIRSGRYPFVRAFAAFAIAAIVAELIVGYADLQLENYRNMIFLGVLLGILNVVPRLEAKAQANTGA